MRKILSITILVLIIGISSYYISKYSKENVDLSSLHEAMYYRKLGKDLVQCELCPRKCILRNRQRGVCGVRENINGKLYSMNYGKVVAMHLDPIEKKPFFHFLPGSMAFSIALPGCNLHCLYCQNWQIAHISEKEAKHIKYLTPEEVVEKAIKSGAQSIAYTYSEPVVFYEFMLDTMKIAKKRGLKNVVVTAGYIQKEPLKELCKYADAIKVDLKAFNQDFYDRLVSGGDLSKILENLKIIKQSGTWLEIVYLVIPNENDNYNEIRKMARWIKENLGENVPLHFTRFYPMYKLKNLPPTPFETLKKAREIAMEEGLKYVYTGNVGDPKTESTYCSDGKIAIKRQGYFIKIIDFKNGKCSNGENIPGVWN